jgi:signal transduction histidine kinase
LVILVVLIVILLRSNRRTKEVNRLLALQHQEALRREQEIIRQNDLLVRQRDEIRLKNEKLTRLDAEKNHLIGVVAHDLQSPMNKVMGFAQLIGMSGPLNEEQQEMLSRMTQVINDGKTLVREVLDLHAIEESHNKAQFESIELQPFLKSIIATHEPHAANKDIRILLDNQANGLTLKTDKSHLTRVMDNLLSNAVKFSPFHREVHIHLKEQEQGVEISVQDQGPGISPEDQQRLFGKFQRLGNRPTAGESSTGIGLAITKGLVEAMRGKISVDSELGKGSAFSVILPRNNSAAV